MKKTSILLPVFVFFDSEGCVISYRHPDCETLYGLSLEEFMETANAFSPSIPNSFVPDPSRYAFPVEITLNDEERVCHVKLSSIDSIYGKTHNELVKFTFTE